MALPRRSHVLHKLIKGKHEYIFSSKTTRPRALIYGMKHHLVDLYQICSNYAPRAKHGPVLGGHMFYMGLYREKMRKSSRLKPQGLKP